MASDKSRNISKERVARRKAKLNPEQQTLDPESNGRSEVVDQR